MTTRQQARNARADARNVHAPEGTHWCSFGHYAPIREFPKNDSKKDGLHNRCSIHEREYRISYEARRGKRTDETKTLRVDLETHEYIMGMKGKLTVAAFLCRAVVFYLRYSCANPDCLAPRGRSTRCPSCSELV